MSEVRYIDAEMKNFIVLTEELLTHYAQATGNAPVEPEPVVEHEEVVAEHPVLGELRDLVFKLKAFMESAEGDYGLGVESGMQRAAEMIENIIRRHQKDDDQLG